MVEIYQGIDQLYTFKRIAAKDGRYPQKEDFSPIKNGALIVNNRRIAWVGKTSDVTQACKELGIKKKDSFVSSLNGYKVCPSFVECHTHSVFGGSRAEEFDKRMLGFSYQEIAQQGGGIISTVKKTRKADEFDLLRRAQKVADRFLAQGVTTLEIKSGYGLRLNDEIKMLKVARKIKRVRSVPTFLGAHAIAPEAENAREYIEDLTEKYLPKIARFGLAKRADIFIEKGYFGLELGKKYLKKAKELGMDITVHADQMNRTGAACLAVDLDAKSADHVIEITSQDARKIARSDTTAVLLPAADFYLKMKYPPARKLIDLGGRVALATDFNPGSSPTHELSLVGLLARLEMKMTLPEVFAAYTFNSAAALGLANELGSLEKGKKADFVAFQGDFEDFFYQVGYSPVKKVFRGGRLAFPK